MAYFLLNLGMYPPRLARFASLAGGGVQERFGAGETCGSGTNHLFCRVTDGALSSRKALCCPFL